VLPEFVCAVLTVNVPAPAFAKERFRQQTGNVALKNVRTSAEVVARQASDDGER